MPQGYTLWNYPECGSPGVPYRLVMGDQSSSQLKGDLGNLPANTLSKSHLCSPIPFSPCLMASQLVAMDPAFPKNDGCLDVEGK